MGRAYLKQTEEDDGSHGGRKERVSGVVDCTAGGNCFSINFGWPLREGEGEGQNCNGQMSLKNSKIECR